MPQTVVLRGRKGNKLKIRQEWEREARQNESDIQKKARLEVRIISNDSQASDHAFPSW